MRLDTDTKLDYIDVLIRPKRSTLKSRKEVDLKRKYKFFHAKSTWTGIPIIAANMDGVGTFSMMKELAKNKMMTALHKYHPAKAYKDTLPDFTFVTTGITDADEKKLSKITRTISPRFICIDVANGYTERFIEFVKKMRKKYPDAVIMAGNVVTGEVTEELILAGADIVKVGIGAGTVCTTRLMAGVGYPQLSAVIECADAAHGLKGLICADGGCRNPGDIAKAFGAGADFVMMGGMFAGHDESEFPIVDVKESNEKYIEHYGSSSKEAMERNGLGKATYKASEGKQILIRYKGKVQDTINEILGGLRSTCTYVGAVRLKELSKRTTFILVNRQLSPEIRD